MRRSIFRSPSNTANASQQEYPLSTLECVVEMLKGTKVLRRRKCILVEEATLWLSPDMASIKWRVSRIGHPINVVDLPLANVRALKESNREISLVKIDEKGSYSFIMPSKSRTQIWYTGLCCLIPEMASVQSRRRQIIDSRKSYDLMKDTFQGKPLSEKRRLQDLVIVGSIGRGAFGSVKLGLNVNNHQFYAIKILSKNMIRRYNRNIQLDGRAAQDATERGEPITELAEIAVMRKLDHENVVKMLKAIDDDEHDCLCIVIEYLPNGPIMSSAKLTGTKPLSENQAREAFVDVLTGLHYLETQRVVHRDIKPDNLLRAGDGTVKISDFGSAKAYEISSDEDEESLGIYPTVGTPAFTAPELCLTDKAPVALSQAYKADIWSLGATLYYMIFGRAPFLASTVMEMYHEICTREHQWPALHEMWLGQEYPSPACCEVLDAVLEKDPRERASIEDILKLPWLADAIEIREKVERLVKMRNEWLATSANS